MGRSSWLLLALALTGCSSESAPERACAPGQVVPCACAGGPATGAQTCRDDGSGYDECVGCAGQGGGGTGGGDGQTEQAFCDAIAQAECSTAVVTACYGSSGAGDTAACVAKRSALAACRESVTGLQAAPGAFRSDYSDACVAVHASIYLDGALDQAELATAYADCLKVYPGPGQAGASCSTDFHCDTIAGLTCIMHGGVGSCGVPTPVGGGENCMAPTAVCPETHYCDLGGSNACISAPGEGAACNATKTCLKGFTCSGGTCAAKLADGADCAVDAPDDCAGGFCNAPTGLLDGKCTSTLVFAQTSSACGDF